MSETPFLFEVNDSVAWLTLNRPDVGNVIDLHMARALAEASIRCQTDPAIRCVVLTGAGKLFCAGGDLNYLASSGNEVAARLSELAGILHLAIARLARMPKPLLVLVNGPAAGAGLSLAISGDVVLAARSAHFTAAYGAIGLTPDGGMSGLLPRLVGLRKAQEIILTNRRVEAAEAEAIGLVTRLVDNEQLLIEGQVTANRRADSAIEAIGAARALLQDSHASGYETHLEREARAISLAGSNAESREGIAAFLSRRPPDFRRSR